MISKINLIKLCMVMISFATTQVSFAQTSQPKPECQTQPEQASTSTSIHRSPRMHRQNEKRYNGSVWGGVGFLFTTENLQSFIAKPLIDYQIGVSKSIWNVTPYDYLYLGLIADFAYSNHSLGGNGIGIASKAFYYFSNEQLVLGYEQRLGTKYFTGFLEAGGAFQQRYFLIQNNSNLSATDYVLGAVFGGTFNAGFNIRIVPEHRISYLFRLAMNLMIGQNQKTTLNYNGEKLNANSLTYGPSVSFGIRM